MSLMPKLDAGQQAAIDAYLQMDSGLVILSSVPGAGKSTAATKAVATELLDRAADGEMVPHERIISVSFSKEDASHIIPDVIAWIETLQDRGEIPKELSEADISELIHHVREAPQIGTVDSLLRSVFKETATELSFDGMPTVGNTALCTHLHRDVSEWLSSQPELQDHLSRLHTAYPTAEYSMDVSDLIRESFVLSRRRMLDADEFTGRLKTAVKSNYCDSKPASFDDILETIRAYRGTDIAAQVEQEATLETKTALIEADLQLHDEWLAIIDDLGVVLESYTARYDELCVDRGAVSHLDCSYWVNQYFTSQPDSLRCERLLRRYHSRIESIVIDEAQDISQIQHDALSHLIDSETRILLAGDLQQCIYDWRDASPELFKRALDDGEYFGRVWSPHETEIANQNYRSRPEIVRLANAVADRTLNHPERGGLRQVETSTPSLYSNRESIDGPSIHVARFQPNGNPGTDQWVDPDAGGNEARVLVSYVSGAVDKGRLLDENGELPSITVLFNTRTQMDGYGSAFEAAGFTVANASTYLFESPVVCAVVAVLEWLCAPTNPAKTEMLLTASPLAGEMSESTFDNTVAEFGAISSKLTAVDWSVSQAAQLDDIDAEYHSVLQGLAALADDGRRLATEPAAVVVREIIDFLQLEADLLNLDHTTGRHQRIATLDRLISLIEEWEGDERYTHRQLCDLLDPFVEKPRLGPLQPVADTQSVDVVFKTIHAMKGDQDDIVILADPTCHLGSKPFDTRRITTAGSDVAIAPPEDVLSKRPPQVPVLSEQLYAPDASPPHITGSPDSAGIRWRAEYWSPGLESSAGCLLGPPVRRKKVAAARAESWRKLYVALTRAREHLILPLPEDDALLSGREHWAQVLYDVIGSETLQSTGLQPISLPDGDGVDQETDVVVNDVPLDARYDSSTTVGQTAPIRPLDGTVPTDVVDQQWLPRFLRPSTLGPQLDDRVNTLIPALRGKSLTAGSESVSPELPLTFETVTTKEVGEMVHQLVTVLVEANIQVESLRSPVASEAVEIVEEFLESYSVEKTESDGLREFLIMWVLPDLGDSSLWERIEQATTIYTEEPLQSLTRINNVDIEIHGQADLLLDMGNGTWHVEDIKTALTSPSEANRRRYQLQIDAYAWVLQQQSNPEVTVVPRVTTVGVCSDEYSIAWPLGAWRQQLIQH